MVIFLQSVIGLAFIFSLVQILGILKIKKSKISVLWFIGTAILIGGFDILAFKFELSGEKLVWYLLLLAVAVWFNVIKFTLGLIQKDEITAYNRFEHAMTGLIVYYALILLGVDNLLALNVNRWTEGFIALLLVNLISVLVEVGELLLDLIRGKKYMIGPKVNDTNWDIFMTLLGGFLGWVILIVTS